MRPSHLLTPVTIDTARLRDGTEFSLVRRGDTWSVRVGSMTLMTNETHASEEALAEHALARAARLDSVLVGGLGLGFTVRAVLDRVPAATKVTTCELLPAVVDWNRRWVGELANHPLADSRNEMVVGDVFDHIKRSSHVFDVILLDVDNGPRALSSASNQRLYGDRGIRTCFRALRPGGVLAIWSVGANARFERALGAAGFGVEVLRVPAFRHGRKKHVLFLATVPGRDESFDVGPRGRV